MENQVETSYGTIDIPAAEGQESASAAPQEQQAAPQAPPEVPWYERHANDELEFNAAGKAIKAPFSKVKQWAQQGYHYAQNMQQFNQQKAEFEAKYGEFQKDAEWSEVAKYARENPEWAEYTRNAWQNRETWRNENADNPLFRELQALKSELNSIKPEVTAFRTERERIQQAEQDKALDADIASVKEKYSKYGMDLSAIDENGNSIEYNVLEYGSKNGIKSFKTAFLELYGDKIEALREEAIKKQVAEEQTKLKKSGFIGRTPTPTNGAKVAQNVRNRSYSDLGEEALADLLAGKY